MFIAAIVRGSQSPFPLEFWCVVGFCAGIGLFVYGFRLLQRRRLILDTPLSKIRSASMGMVEISGLAVGPYIMTAPITGRECYYFRTIAWEWKQQGKNKQWVKVAGECMHVPFFVDDNTGRMLIDPRGADLDLHRDFQQEFNTAFFSHSDDAPSNVVNFLARHGVVTSNKIKVEEYCIKPKNSLFILGTLAENPGIQVTDQPIVDDQPVNSFTTGKLTLSISFNREGNNGWSMVPMVAPRDTLARQIVGGPQAGLGILASAEQQKVVDALTKAGITNPAAWAAAGVAGAASGVQPAKDARFAPIPSGRNSVEVEAGAANGFDPRPPVVLMKGTNNKAFIISWRSQKEVAQSLGWKCALMIWGGPPLALLSLYVSLAIWKLL